MGNAGYVYISTSHTIYTDLNLDLHKVYVDDESYNSGHGRAYEFYGVDPVQGAVVIVRPDQCEFSHPKFCLNQLT
jgi:hypothetical protein